VTGQRLGTDQVDHSQGVGPTQATPEVLVGIGIEWPVAAGDRRHVGSLAEHPVGFFELADNLLGVCLRLAIVNILPSPRSLGNGLSSRVDQSQGVGPVGLVNF
jgi:hypothetical protein